MGNSPCTGGRSKATVVEQDDSEEMDPESPIGSIESPIGSINEEEFAKSEQVKRREPVFGGGWEEEKPYEEKRDTTKSEEDIKFIDDCCKSGMLFSV